MGENAAHDPVCHVQPVQASNHGYQCLLVGKVKVESWPMA